MANEATLNMLVRRVRQRADEINSMTFDDATELKPWIKGSLSQLRDIMVAAWQEWFRAKVPLSLLAGLGTYALPSDFRAMTDVFLVAGVSGKVRLYEYQVDEASGYIPAVGGPAAYRVTGNQFHLFPRPVADAFNALELVYVPQYRAPLLDYSPCCDTLPNGWEEWAVLDVLQKMATKTRTLDIGNVIDSKAMVEKRILSHMRRRTADAPRMRNINDRGGIGPYGTPLGPQYWV